MSLAAEQSRFEPSTDTSLGRLPRREREVAQGILKGWSTKQMANAMGLSPRTVETYRTRLFDHFDVRNATQLALLLGRSRTSLPTGPKPAIAAPPRELGFLAAMPRTPVGPDALPLRDILRGVSYFDRPLETAVNVFMMWNDAAEPSGFILAPSDVAIRLSGEGYPAINVANPLLFALTYALFIGMQAGLPVRLTGDKRVWSSSWGELPLGEL